MLAFDEMKIREDLVFDKNTGEMIGFVDLGDEGLNDRFTALRKQCAQQNGLCCDNRTVATHMLALMVRGIFFKLNLPFAHFATTGM